MSDMIVKPINVSDKICTLVYKSVVIHKVDHVTYNHRVHAVTKVQINNNIDHQIVYLNQLNLNENNQKRIYNNQEMINKIDYLVTINNTLHKKFLTVVENNTVVVTGTNFA